MSKLPFILGGSALAAYLWSRSRNNHQIVRPESLPGEWVWPVPSWSGRAPVVSDGFASHREGFPFHGGFDIMFRRQPQDLFRVGSVNGSRMFVMPDGITAVAARDGLVWSALKTPIGFSVVIDHGKPFATYYTHLERLLVEEAAPHRGGQRVVAGQPIGIIGGNPRDAPHLKHLHFEVWEGGPSEKIDAELAMRAWKVVSSPREALVARNAGFTYRPLGKRGEPYPQWVRDLDGESGVYVIRERRTHETVYVGSSVRRLYATLTRHFQEWRRYKGFWKGQYAEGHDPGLTYARDSVEVAVRITRADDALDEEARLIQRLRPRDNLLGQPVEEEVPF